MEAEAQKAVAIAWRARERVEWEARGLFASLTADLQATGTGATLVAMARQAARDEERHARRCRDLVRRFAERFEGGPPAPLPPRRLCLGPDELSRERRALFTSVALSCVTETLSTAFLLQLRARAVDEAVRSTVREILRDEVDHARLGWAHLAGAAKRDSVAWLSPHLPAMLEYALGNGAQAEDVDLAGYGILPRSDSLEIFRNVASDVLLPGLERFNVDTAAASAWCGRHWGAR
jgi:hypothetical protein